MFLYLILFDKFHWAYLPVMSDCVSFAPLEKKSLKIVFTHLPSVTKSKEDGGHQVQADHTAESRYADEERDKFSRTYT